MGQKQDFLDKCLTETENVDVSFAEARIFSKMNERINMKKGYVEEARSTFEQGFNVRIILNGAWGYATSSRLNEADIPLVVKQAIDVAKASSLKLRKPVTLTEEPIITDTYITPFKIDPFEANIEEKIELLKLADSTMREAGEQIKVTESEIDSHKIKLFFANSEGTKINQEQTYVGCTVRATAVGMEVQRRSSRDYQMRGFELTQDFDFEAEATRVAKEALILINKAENCPSGKTAFILEPDQLGLTIHESTGHPTELDRVMGFEADFAGTSFLTVDKLGTNYRYGSEIVNLVCDPQMPQVNGHYKYDDEGVETKRFYIVENGIFKNYMTDRETAHEIGYKNSFGNARMSNYNRIPMVRMSNLILESDPQGPKDIDELIAETKRGIFGHTWKSHSIDDKRINFQFSTELGWLIENGELKKPLKNVCYNAATPEFWNNCDMITQASQIFGHGPVCGKGIPMQGMWVSHGGGWARFQGVNLFAS
ncbi:MAG: TldD/PmbA family protein [Candidatus Hodarchaeales archaeon]|jgi:TldD protein